jgi:hypothetical protein
VKQFYASLEVLMDKGRSSDSNNTNNGTSGSSSDGDASVVSRVVDPASAAAALPHAPPTSTNEDEGAVCG